MIFKVVPFSRKNYGYAPALYVDAEAKAPVKDIAANAREMSGLGRFEDWDFHSHITKLKSK